MSGFSLAVRGPLLNHVDGDEPELWTAGLPKEVILGLLRKATPTSTFNDWTEITPSFLKSGRLEIRSKAVPISCPRICAADLLLVMSIRHNLNSICKMYII